MDATRNDGKGKRLYFKKLRRKDHIPRGYILASVRELQKEVVLKQVREQGIISSQDIVRLRDGWIECLNYGNCAPKKQFRPGMHHKLVIKHGKSSNLEETYASTDDETSKILQFLYDCEEGCRNTDRSTFQKLLTKADPETGWTALHSAAISDDVKFMRDLVLPQLRHANSLNVFINRPTNKDKIIEFAYPCLGRHLTPLHVAMTRSTTPKEMVELLLDKPVYKGADASILDGDGRLPLLLGIQNQAPLRLLQPLLEHMDIDTKKTNYKVTANLKFQLKEAVQYIVAARTDEVLDATPSISPLLTRLKNRPGSDDGTEENLLMYSFMQTAVKNNHLQLFEDLLRALINGQNRPTRLPDVKDENQRTLLHYAIMLSRSRHHWPWDKYIEKLLTTSSVGTSTDHAKTADLLFWAEDRTGRVAYEYVGKKEVDEQAHYPWLGKVFEIYSPGKEKAFKGLQRAARQGKVQLARLLLNFIVDHICEKKCSRGGLEWKEMEELVVEERLAKDDLQWKALLSKEEKHNVMEVSKSLRLQIIYQNKDEVQHHVKQATDQPTHDDFLGRQPFVDALATLILNPFVGTPITIGIYGDWGAGKSSLMLQVEIRLFQIVIEQAISKLKLDNETDVVKQIIQKYKTARYHSQLKSLALMNYNFRNLQMKKPSLLPPSFSLNACRTIVTNAWRKNQHCVIPRIATEEMEETPPILTVRYNAWQYQDEKQALAGLANEIIKEMEAAMTTPQWLSMCWSNSVNGRRHGNTPTIVMLSIAFILTVIGLVTWVSWKLLSQTSNSGLQALKYGSVPVALITMVWAVVKQIGFLVLPVSRRLSVMFTSISHNENLGYHQQVIEDILFLKEELLKRPSWIWRCLGCVRVHVFRQDKRDYLILKDGNNLRIPKLEKISDKLRVVVFVDDLDRCNEDTILQVLSSIGLVLSVCEFNVVLGVDKSIVLRCIRTKFLPSAAERREAQDEHSPEEMAERYLEKIVQLPVVLPDPGDKKMGELLAGQMGFWSKRRDIAIRVETSSSSTVGVDVPDSDAGTSTTRPADSEDVGLAYADPLFAKYTAQDCAMFQDLQKHTRDAMKHPREWKRFMNYHRLAYNVVCKAPDVNNMKPKWKEELMVWVFVCWHFKDLMNKIIEDWNKNPYHSLSLLKIVEAKIVEAKSEEVKSVEAKSKSNTDDPKKLWENMKLLLQKYDVSKEGIQMFQDFRFQCKQGHLAAAAAAKSYPPEHHP